MSDLKRKLKDIDLGIKRTRVVDDLSVGAQGFLAGTGGYNIAQWLYVST